MLLLRLIRFLIIFVLLTMTFLFYHSKPIQEEQMENETEEEPNPTINVTEWLPKAVWAAKDKVKRDFKTHKMTYPKERVFVLLVTTWRSGSTFLGELLALMPGAFYNFEPLVYFDKVKTSKGNTNDQINLLSNLFRCNSSQDFLRIAAQRANNYMLFRNLKLFHLCKSRLHKKELCHEKTFFDAVCEVHPVRIAKTVRLRLEAAEKLLQVFPGLKVILLIRDPRGFLLSRSKLHWCGPPSCSDPKTTCGHLQSDLEAVVTLRKRFPSSVYLMRYEDVCLHPMTHIESLFHFLGFTLSAKLRHYVSVHTHTEVMDSFKHGTRRDSKSHAFNWAKSIQREQLENIQGVCQRAMAKAGYRTLAVEELSQFQSDPENHNLNILTYPQL